ncbi:hypothetical protein SNEBB_010885 [Seison nebaliae]|nr:hypothetical protein SNEBB_010885 [Seison nebaliae]
MRLIERRHFQRVKRIELEQIYFIRVSDNNLIEGQIYSIQEKFRQVLCFDINNGKKFKVELTSDNFFKSYLYPLNGRRLKKFYVKSKWASNKLYSFLRAISSSSHNQFQVKVSICGTFIRLLEEEMEGQYMDYS